MSNKRNNGIGESNGYCSLLERKTVLPKAAIVTQFSLSLDCLSYATSLNIFLSSNIMLHIISIAFDFSIV